MNKFKSYPARFEEGDGVTTVLFRDLPGAITEGDTFEEAFKNAQEALEGYLESMLDREVEFALPSVKEDGEVDIPIPVYIAFSILMRAEREAKGWSQTEFARKIGVSQQQAALFEKPTRERKLSSIVNILDKLGYELEITGKTTV